MNIKIIGADCSNGIKLSKMVKRAIDDIDMDVNLEETNDINEKSKFGIKNIPGLVINNKLVSEGKVLKVREIYKLLNS